MRKFLQELGRSQFRSPNGLRLLASWRLKLWALIMPLGIIFPCGMIVASGHIAEGFALVAVGLIISAPIVWVRWLQVQPILDERKQEKNRGRR